MTEPVQPTTKNQVKEQLNLLETEMLKPIEEKIILIIKLQKQLLVSQDRGIQSAMEQELLDFGMFIADYVKEYRNYGLEIDLLTEDLWGTVRPTFSSDVGATRKINTDNRVLVITKEIKKSNKDRYISIQQNLQRMSRHISNLFFQNQADERKQADIIRNTNEV